MTESVVASLVAGAWCGVFEGARGALTAPRPFLPVHFAEAVAAYALSAPFAGLAALILFRKRLAACSLPGRAAAAVVFVAGTLLIAGRLLPRRHATTSLPLNALLTAGATVALAAVLLGILRWRASVPRERAAGSGLRAAVRPGLLAIPPILAAVICALWPVLPGDLTRAPAALLRSGDPPPNVLVVLVDSLRADRVGATGGSLGLTPRIDTFAAEGASFLSMRTSSPWTKPSVASLHTGLRPERHGVTTVEAVLPVTAPTMLSFFQRVGYRTALITDSHWPVPEFGFDHGVDSLLVTPNAGDLRGTSLWRTPADIRDYLVDAYDLEHPSEMRGAPDLAERFLRWAGKKDDRPFAAYLHWMEPHHPYSPAGEDGPPRPRIPVPIFLGTLPLDRGRAMDPAALTNMIANYDDEVREIDAVFGRVVDGLRAAGLLDNTVVVFLSDHGEEFHEHGGWTHGHSLFDEIVRIPCVVVAPGRIPRGTKVEAPARIEDLLPTVLNLAGIETDVAFDGRPLFAPAASSPGDPIPWTGYCRRITSPTTLRAALLGGSKLLMAEREGAVSEWVYNLSADAGEMLPIEPEGETAAALRRALGDAMSITPLATESTDLDEDTRKALTGLGYFSSPDGNK